MRKIILIKISWVSVFMIRKVKKLLAFQILRFSRELTMKI